MQEQPLPHTLSRKSPWIGSGVLSAPIRRDHVRSCVTIGLVLKGCLPHNCMWAQPWRAVDILWGGAIWQRLV
jgi:hypothetical protein